ncbi:MAG: hypothetical protein L3J43_07650 [Sulfurovum sp.]|nr:hypothetical protein [Sulfurovum sp.]
MKSKFEKSLRAIRTQLKRVTDEKKKEALRQELKIIKKLMQQSKIS